MQIDRWIIDADTHITEPGDVWTSRLPAKYQDRAPRIVRDDDGRDAWSFGADAWAVPIGSTAQGIWHEPFPASPKNMDEVPAAAYDASARLEYMDRVGIWAMALYPNIGGFGNEGFLRLGDPELMLACVQAYNDWLIDWTSPAPERFIPILATPFWDVDATVAEIERGASIGHKGVLFTGEPQVLGEPVLGDPHWDPIWAACQDAGLSVQFHIGGADFTKDFTPERVASAGVGATNTRALASLFLGNAVQVADLLLSGVLPRFPDLNFVSVESGIGWVPFLLETCDYGFHYSNVATERPVFEMLPSEYFHRQVYACSLFERGSIQRELDAIGVGNVLFETDYPHPVCLHGNVRETIDDALGGRSAAEQDAVLWHNAAELYGVEPPAVAWDPTTHREFARAS